MDSMKSGLVYMVLVLALGFVAGLGWGLVLGLAR